MEIVSTGAHLFVLVVSIDSFHANRNILEIQALIGQKGRAARFLRREARHAPIRRIAARFCVDRLIGSGST